MKRMPPIKPDWKREVLLGTLDEKSPLSPLRGNALVLSDIFERLYDVHIDRASVAYKAMKANRYPYMVHRPKVTFPAPTGLNINMMPIYLYSEDCLPEFCRQYYPMIRQCPVLNYVTMVQDPSGRNYRWRVAYLTVHESLVPVGETQRRPGVHIERPAGGGKGSICRKADDPQAYFDLAWGLGMWHSEEDRPVDGIYMASTVAGSTAIWPALIDRPEEVTDRHGSLDSALVSRLGPGNAIGANELVWFTDRTPHQALPIRAPESDPGATHVYRQFFRLVVGPISVWYSKHNTPNPLGPLPDAPISDEDKFS